MFIKKRFHIFIGFILIASVVTDNSKLTTNGENNVITNKNANSVDQKKKECTELARDESTLMVFSTLGGGLTAIDPITSEMRWSIADDPPIKCEQGQPQNVRTPQYLPDPRDGSIYQLGDMGNLKKLPFTIPQLVANAPCRSSDGILYSGKKSDTWFIVDPVNGRRETVNFEKSTIWDSNPTSTSSRSDGNERIGWATSRSIYLGRTQYTVMIYDSSTQDINKKLWNITFYDYSAMAITPDISKDYEYLHLTTTSNGKLLTLDRKSGKFLWQNDLSSPIVAAFLLGSEGLLSVPFTTLSDEAFYSIQEASKVGNVNTVKLFQSLYIGEHRHGLYALTSLVDKNTPKILTSPPIKLLDGPNVQLEDDSKTVYLNEVFENNAGIVFGHYNMPNDMNLQILPTPIELKGISNHDLATINVGLGLSNFFSSNPNKKILDVSSQSDTFTNVVNETSANITSSNNDNKYDNDDDRFNKTLLVLTKNGLLQRFLNEWLMEHPNSQVHQILCVIVLIMAGMFWYMHSITRELKNQSENGSRNSSTNDGSRSSENSNFSGQDLMDMNDDLIKVGKICFNTTEILGKGCEGTFVYKGTFEERNVAVKRLLPECFTVADREVALLRESDAHENVVRYFCTEQDRQFRYIAVELCAATLQDYTEGENCTKLRSQISVWEVLKQSVAGLSHLHSLRIVHRDIKPQNVLLSLPDANGRVRVMISDFGLCKKLNVGKASFSRRSGVTGTDGWIAPELIKGQRTTASVDIFSMGCVYYYVLSGGQHLFGDVLKRQANILANDFSSAYFGTTPKESQWKMILAEQLIIDMINKNPQRRPPAHCISNHPIFWNSKQILAYFQDVSEFVEKLEFCQEPLRTLERNGNIVVVDDWNLQLEALLTEDLRKYRGYMGASVRDLLRALRNKKNHYNELSQEMQQLLGSLPHEFTNYWLSRFPNLLSHVYHAFSICSKRPIFQSYYNESYHFTRPDYFEVNEELLPTLCQRDPKLLVKQSTNATSVNSPKKMSTQQKPQIRHRRGAYNFRRNNDADDNSKQLTQRRQNSNDFSNLKCRRFRNNSNSSVTVGKTYNESLIGEAVTTNLN